MNNTKNNIVIIALVAGISLISQLCSAGISEEQKQAIEQGILELEYAAIQMEAIDNDMYFYLGWEFADKEQMQKTAQELGQNLKKIKAHVLTQDFPLEMASLQESMVALIDGLMEIYKDIEKKDRPSIDKEYSLYQEQGSAHNQQLTALIDEFVDIPLLEDFDYIAEEHRSAEATDAASYEQALSLIKDKQFPKAYDILDRLKEKYAGQELELSIALRMSDCLLHDKSDMSQGIDADEKALQLLTSIVNAGRYSPILQEAFLKWRTIDQYYNQGMSNYSQIPNQAYNEKRWELVKLVRSYYDEHTDDLWAKVQEFLLIDIPNILRGDLMGNTNLRYWAALYTDEEQ
jgi:hypothetical protein